MDLEDANGVSGSEEGERGFFDGGGGTGSFVGVLGLGCGGGEGGERSEGCDGDDDG